MDPDRVRDWERVLREFLITFVLGFAFFLYPIGVIAGVSPYNPGSALARALRLTLVFVPFCALPAAALGLAAVLLRVSLLRVDPAKRSAGLHGALRGLRVGLVAWLVLMPLWFLGHLMWGNSTPPYYLLRVMLAAGLGVDAVLVKPLAAAGGAVSDAEGTAVNGVRLAIIGLVSSLSWVAIGAMVSSFASKVRRTE